jgi:hypothetical protein
MKKLIFITGLIIFCVEIFSQYTKIEDKYTFAQLTGNGDTLVISKDKILLDQQGSNLYLIIDYGSKTKSYLITPANWGFSTNLELRDAINNVLYPSYSKWYITNGSDDTTRSINYNMITSSDTTLIHTDTLKYDSGVISIFEPTYP